MNTSSVNLSQEQIAFFRENGYLQIHHFLSPDEAARMKAVLVRAIQKYDALQREKALTGEGAVILRDAAYSKVLNQKVNVWRVDEEMRRVVFDRRFAEAARQLTGARAIRLFHDHALLKMPGDSKPTPWHQDTVYWPMNEDGALSIWIALDDVDERNGCLSFLPKSRNFGRLEPISLANPADIFKQLKSGQKVEQVQNMPMKAGGVTFHDGLTFHYAHANQTDKPRHALAIIYMPDGVTYSGKTHPLTDGLGLIQGEPIAGELFPVLAVDPAAEAVATAG